MTTPIPFYLALHPTYFKVIKKVNSVSLGVRAAKNCKFVVYF